MGFKPEAKQYNLTFVDYPGLEITALGADLGELDTTSQMNSNLNHPDRKKRLELFEFFATKLVAWNMQHMAVRNSDGTPECKRCGCVEDDYLLPEADAMLCVPIEIMVAIVLGWAMAISRVSLPKGLSSNDGGKSGPSTPLPDGLTEEITRQLEQLQNPTKLPEPNFG